ncbi:hypothetical protein EVAR_27914_1 [Eumeta japonica]|uniref:Ig-like domain-containing protein n=1 Tax=Eumeta variegata TaxID=151549 RepID=A0A4C1UVP1_EUMVA|nr:hypothetical protein EVAR_27914_1 [Eumeta japonica]
MILAHSGAVFASDSRLDVAVEADGAGVTRHALSIAGARPADSGRYECQLNTNPKRSLFFDLNVYEKKDRLVTATIKGPIVRSVRLGDEFTVECEAREGGDGTDPEGDVDIRWLHEGRPLTREAGGGLWLETQRWPHRALSKLTVGRIGEGDAGRYTCAAGDVTAHVRLRIRSESDDDENCVTGERSEAMQRDQEPAAAGTAARPPGADLAPLLVVILTSAARAA